MLDILMPQMRGDELARQLRQRDPDAKVLYLTTGHSDRPLDDRQVLWEHEAFIDKPVSITGNSRIAAAGGQKPFQAEILHALMREMSYCSGSN